MSGSRSRTGVHSLDGEPGGEWFETVLETVGDGVYQLDSDGRFVAVNSTVTEVTGYRPEELLGEHVSKILDDAGVDRARAELRQLRSDDQRSVGTAEASVHTAGGETVPYEIRLSLLEEDGEVTGSVGVVRDVTHRRERERRRYETIVESAQDGIYTVDGTNHFTSVNHAYATMLGYEPSDLVGEHVSVVLDEESVEMVGELTAGLSVDERLPEPRQVTVETADGDEREVEGTIAMTRIDGEVQRVGVVRDVTERNERQRELRAKRERLATLNELNEAVQEVTHAVVEAESREAIERAVGEQLVNTEPFTVAWFGEVAPGGEEVQLRTAAGVEGCLDSIDVPMDDDADVGPVVRAVRTGETQTAGDVLEERNPEPWREKASEHDFRSLAAVPVEHQGVLYGVLVVHARQPRAFDESVTEILDRLGATVGHAINARERKRALVGEEVVEVDFNFNGAIAAMDVEGASEGRIVIDRILPVGEGRYVAHGTASTEGTTLLENLMEAMPHFGDVEFFAAGDGDVKFALELEDPPVVAHVAALGGRIEGATITDGSYHMTVQLPYDADVRTVVERVEETYPDTEVVAQRRTQRETPAVDTFGTVLDEELTERQRTALEAAYVAGFFEWPREQTGEELADRLGVSPPTFHEHLRAAERRVLTALFGR